MEDVSFGRVAVILFIAVLGILLIMFGAHQIARAAGRGWFRSRWEMWDKYNKQKRG
jgi:hypothetical protein